MIDLHMHSYFSVGSNTPKKMIHKFVQISLTGIALSHHNTINGCFCLKKEAERHPAIKAVNGCEFSAEYPPTIETIDLNIKLSIKNLKQTFFYCKNSRNNKRRKHDI